MLLRSAFAALVALGAVAVAAAEPRDRSAAPGVAGVEGAPTTTERIRPGLRPPVVIGPTIMEAENSFTCASGVTYTLSVNGGRCTPDKVTLPNGQQVTRGMSCTSGGGAASATCTGGCNETTGSGTCNIQR